MDAAEVEQILRVFESSLSTIKWRLKSSSKRRLETDILALCTEMRPVIMVDYGGKMPELQEHLCAFLEHCRKESSAFELLHVMVIDDMIYMIHIKALAEFVQSSLNLETEVVLVDLEQEPPKMITSASKSLASMQLLSAQKLFSRVFPVKAVYTELLQYNRTDMMPHESSSDGPITIQSPGFIDLSSSIQETQVTVPTLNGWLLGYPIVYLLSKEHIEDAIYNLSTKSLHIFQILVSRSGRSSKGTSQELLSFSVPYDLSFGGSDEPWAKAFLSRMKARWERCKHVWGSLHMETLPGSIHVNEEVFKFKKDMLILHKLPIHWGWLSSALSS